VQRLVFLIFLLCSQASFAQDLSDAQVKLHPTFPENGPFVLEVSGTWDSACNPQAAEPVITHFDGESLEIDFVLDQCPPSLSIPYPYRVLVDISPAFEGDETSSLELEVTLRFGSQTHTDTVLLSCPLCDPPPPEQRTFPEPGLYQAFGHEKQGLLLARQNDRLAAYPLVYDAAGSSEWLFAGGGIVGDAYFAPLYQASGGQCLGCPPPAQLPSLEPIGDITLVFDSQSIVQMQIDDGPFVEYHQLNFGRVTRGEHLPDLAGTWALLDSKPGSAPDETVEPEQALPGVFEIRFDELTDNGEVTLANYHLRDLESQVISALVCEAEVPVPPPFAWHHYPLHCKLTLSGDEEDTIRYDAVLVSMDRLELTGIEPLPDGAAAPTGIIVRATP